jgi:hypothetical protein
MEEQQIRNELIHALLANQRYENYLLDDIIFVAERLTQYIMNGVDEDDDEIIRIESPGNLSERLKNFSE